MPITFGGQQCGDPHEFFDICRAQRMPTEPWLAKVNSFRNPMGAGPGIGHLLLSRASLTALGDLSTAKTLLLDDFATKITLQNITVIETQCLTPGVRSDIAAVYMVTVADRRHRIRQIPAGTSYNLRDPSGSGYLSASLNSGTAWTWQEMVDELTDALDIGTVTLPYTPDGKPENFSFFNQYAWDALNLIARRLGCGMVYDPIGDTFTMVEVGAADATAVAALEQADRFRAWDADQLSLGSAKMPAAVNVVYPKFPAPGDGTSPFEVTQTAISTASPYTDSAVYINGDLGSPAESGQSLSARATERAAKWYQAASDSTLNPMLRVYACLLADSTLKKPGKRIKAVAWYDRGDGLKTELYRGGEWLREEFELPSGSSSGSTVKHCRVAFAAITSGAVRYYPATFRTLTVASDTYDNGTPYQCFLVQDKDYDLTVNGTGDPGADGPGCYTAILQSGTKTLTVDGVSETLPVYLTTEAPFLGPTCEVQN